MSDIDTTQSPSSVFYGYFSKYTWRNEKNGNSFFRIVTKQELFFEQQYCKKEVKKNPITEQEETLYTISCDGSKYPVPAYDEKTPESEDFSEIFMIKDSDGIFKSQILEKALPMK